MEGSKGGWKERRVGEREEGRKERKDARHDGTHQLGL
jgi:hypothetical protein